MVSIHFDVQNLLEILGVGVDTIKLGLDGVPLGPERFELLEQIVDLVRGNGEDAA